MVNKVILLGRLVADPELRVTPDGRQVANVRIATNRYGPRDESGARRETSHFHRVVLFGGLADVAGSYLRKGRLAYVEGYMHERSWEGDDGQTRHRTEVVANTLKLVEPKPGDGDS